MKRVVFLDRDGVVNGVQVQNGKPALPPSDLASLEYCLAPLIYSGG